MKVFATSLLVLCLGLVPVVSAAPQKGRSSAPAGNRGSFGNGSGHNFNNNRGNGSSHNINHGKSNNVGKQHHQHSLGYTHRGHTYNYHHYNSSWRGWNHRTWHNRRNYWIYYSPSDNCWYRYDETDEVYLPIED